MNLYANDLLQSPFGLLASLLLGALFGFWLERAGFGSSRKLTAIFYARDFAVLKVMFSAMAVAALVLQLLAWRGVVDPAQLYVPDTVLGAQAVGGALFGLGFVVGGFCPGTAVVGLGSGRVDALVFLIGAGAGSLLFAAVADELAGLRSLGDCGPCDAAVLAGVSPATGAVVLAAVALGAFAFAHAVERRMRARPE